MTIFEQFVEFESEQNRIIGFAQQANQLKQVAEFATDWNVTGGYAANDSANLNAIAKRLTKAVEDGKEELELTHGEMFLRSDKPHYTEKGNLVEPFSAKVQIAIIDSLFKFQLSQGFLNGYGPSDYPHYKAQLLADWQPRFVWANIYHLLTK